MRIFLFFIIACYTIIPHAMDFNLRSITQQGKQVFFIELGPFDNETNAHSLEKKITPVSTYPIQIKPASDSKAYLIQIGPIDNYTTAHELQKRITNTLEPTKPRVSSTPVIPPVADGKLWNLRNADIRAVISEVSRITGKNFVIDPRVQGKISIVSSTPMSNKELYHVFLSMLQVSGYAAINGDGIIKIVPNMDAKIQSSTIPSNQGPHRFGDDMMVEVIPVHYVPAEQLVPVLRPLMPTWSNVSAYSPSNMLILSGRANNINELATIIKQVDTSSATGIDMIPLRHALAMDVANTLKDLVKTQPGGGGGQQTQTTLAADDRSNAILISGNKTERIRLRLLIAQLDKPSYDGTNSNTQVIYLNYLRAEDLVPILAGIAQANFSGIVGTTIGTITRPALDSTNPASNFASGTSSSNTPTPPPTTNPAATPNTASAATQNEGNTKPTVQIIAEPNTNSIIINAPATLIRTLKSVVSQLDIKPAQLLIEAMVVELNETDFNDLGIEWGSINQDTLDSTTFRPGFAILNSKTSLKQFQAQIYALSRAHRANILSSPSVVVLDNRQAKILIGKQVSVATSSYPNNANATTTASPYTTFDRVNVALHLYVRPQITRGQGIQLQIDQGNDTLENPTSIDTGTTPTFNISAIVTSVHVESGDVIVLGGLAQDSLGNDNDGIPILGDIPGIGRLFQRNAANRGKKILMVFIRPHILRNERDAIEITSGKYNHVRDDQLNFVRNQETYHEQDNAVIVPPLTQKALPKPFCHVQPAQLAIK